MPSSLQQITSTGVRATAWLRPRPYGGQGMMFATSIQSRARTRRSPRLQSYDAGDGGFIPIANRAVGRAIRTHGTPRNLLQEQLLLRRAGLDVHLGHGGHVLPFVRQSSAATCLAAVYRTVELQLVRCVATCHAHRANTKPRLWLLQASGSTGWCRSDDGGTAVTGTIGRPFGHVLRDTDQQCDMCVYNTVERRDA